MENKEIGIYVHIPFCKRKCCYCDFISYSNKDSKIEEYIQAVKKEIAWQKTKSEITTGYIGGGTPSYIESRYIKEILEEIQNKNVNENAEITIEVNPGTVTIEKLRDYKEAGINRLSIGLQSANDELLKQIGRIHNFEQFLETYEMARNVGFENINVDLMFGLIFSISFSSCLREISRQINGTIFQNNTQRIKSTIIVVSPCKLKGKICDTIIVKEL